MLPFTLYLHFLRAPKFTRLIFGALRIVKNRVILVFIIATLPVNLLKILFTLLPMWPGYGAVEIHFLKGSHTDHVCTTMYKLTHNIGNMLGCSKVRYH